MNPAVWRTQGEISAGLAVALIDHQTGSGGITELTEQHREYEGYNLITVDLTIALHHQGQCLMFQV